MKSIPKEVSEETILAQWQTCVEMANSVSERRDTMNNLFMSLNLAIVAAFSFIADIKSIFLLVSGIVVCFVWIKFINNFRYLNTAKFEVISILEKQLPVQAFRQEWTAVKKTKYIEGTKLEKIMPYAFQVLYICGACYILYTRFGGQ